MRDIKCFGVVLVFMVVTVLSAFSLVKLASTMFDMPEGATSRAMRYCKDAGGTPVLENGEQYKACAINGKSDTRNVVK